MGWPMAASLVKAGFDVTVNDAPPAEVANNFVQQVGGDAPTALRRLAAGCGRRRHHAADQQIVEHGAGERRRHRWPA